MTAATKAPPTDTGRCGESAGYDRHHRNGEHACRPCRDAKSAQQERYRRRKPPRYPYVPAKPLNPASPFGRFAGVYVRHPFRPMGTQCLECFGWPDDVRHPVVGP